MEEKNNSTPDLKKILEFAGLDNAQQLVSMIPEKNIVTHRLVTEAQRTRYNKAMAEHYARQMLTLKKELEWYECRAKIIEYKRILEGHDQERKILVDKVFEILNSAINEENKSLSSKELASLRGVVLNAIRM